ncbi:TonB-dependent receptor [Pedobacter heparinus]|uniref:TonB-dependent receptor n=1 Tax=Pedobacter heparinus TaxID=984 RepID=UPI002931E8A1|nr:TonB-dependent receptor [Pedobacter heparinus]
MRIFCSLIIASIFILNVIDARAQHASVSLAANATYIGTTKGIVRDTAHNYALRSATVSVYKSADSSLLSYQITNNYGEFNFKNLPVNLPLRLEVSHVGYQLLRKNFTIPAAKNTIDLQTLIISPRDITLKDVVISVPPISMNGDTLEFNAAAFKLDSNAVVEDLLRKIPNITVWGDGQITVNGREIKSLLVNGKPFFDGDMKIATQNIAKNALAKIQVYNTAKNESNPLDSTLEMNLKLKKGKDIGYFGKIGVGYGTNGRYEADANFNIFSPKMQIAIVGASNNINKLASNARTLVSNSTFKGTGANIDYQPDFRSSGITRPVAAGVTFNYNFVEKPTYNNRSTFKADYFLINKHTDEISETKTTTSVNSTDQIFENSNRTNTAIATDQRFSSDYDWAKESHSMKFTNSLSLNQGENTSQTFRTAGNPDQALTSTNNAFNENNFKNTSFKLDGKYQFSQSNWRPKQLLRQFNATYALAVNDKENQRLNLTEFISYTNPADNRKFNRKYSTKSNAISQQLDVEFPALKQLFFGDKNLAGLDFSISNKFNVRSDKGHNQVEDFNAVTNTYEGNSYLNNQVQTHILDETPGLSIRRMFYSRLANRYQKSLNLSFSPKLNFIYQDNQSQKSFQNIRRSYHNILPDASVDYSNSQFGEHYRTYRLNFTTVIRIPGIQQLAPLVDSTNLYHLQRGNVNLREMADKSISFNFNHYDQTTKNTLNYNASVTAGMIDRNIVDSILIDADNRRTVYLVNANGNKYLNFFGSVQKAFKFKTTELQIRLNSSLNTTRNPGYTNGIFTFSNNLNTNSSANINYTYKSFLALAVGQNYSTYHTKQKAFNTQYSGKNISSSLSSSYNVTKKFTLNSNITFNTSSSSGSEAVNFTIWNASAIYRFLKGNNAELKFSALDLLHQNNSVINYGYANSFTVGTQNVLQQYFMTTLSYYPRRFGKKEVKPPK